MPSYHPTREQTRAMEVEKGNFLISAAAGSGKTATLTERVHNLLLQGHSIDEFLILTFTDKAASEMKDRIRNMISKDPTLFNELPKLDAAHIMTFDSYAMEIVKKYHYLLDLDKNISICTNGVIEVEKYLYLEKLFNKYYEEKDVDFIKLIMDFSTKSDDKLQGYIIEIEKHAAEHRNEKEYFDTYISKYYDESKIDADINFYIKLIKEEIYNLTSTLLNNITNSYFSSVVDEQIDNLISLSDNDLFLAQLADFDFRFSGHSKNDMVLDEYEKDFLKKYKSKFNEIRRNFGPNLNIKTIKDNYLSTKQYVVKLIEIAYKLYVHINEFKNKHGLYVFADISHFALKLVSDTNIANEIKEGISYIMIDEYQDTNQIQEDFIQAIANNNVYAVGDIKQSIYGFRGADCEIFKNKDIDFKKNNTGEVIELFNNFRSRPELLAAINKVFLPVMSLAHGGADYKLQKFKEENVRYIDSSFEDDKPLEIKQYEKDDGMDANNQKAFEANLVALDIKHKIDEGYKVFDKDLHAMRQCKFSDFSILVENHNAFPYLTEAFNTYGLPLKVETKRNVRETDIVLTVKSIFDLITLISSNSDNEIAIKHAYVAIARSYLYMYKDENIRLSLINNAYRIDDLFISIEKIARYAIHRSIEDTFRYIFNVTGLVEKLYLCDDVEINFETLQILMETAIQMDQIGYTVKDFDFYLNNLERYNAEINIEPTSQPGDYVRAMTIHSSKGLEFKIVYLFGAGFDGRSHKDSKTFNVTDEYGIILANPLNGNTNFYSYLNQVNATKAQTSERIRLFYVALTRAEDKMIISMPTLEYKPNFGLDYCERFYEYIEEAQLDSSFFTNYEIKPIKENNLKEYVSGERLTIKEVNIENKVIEITRASKSLSDDEVNHDILEFGTHIHYLLELVNFNTKDTSFIKDKNDKELIDKFLSNKIFDTVKSAKVFHEYQFSNNDIKGIIDLLLVYEDHAEVVDFKLKHIDDEAYKRQINIYADYVYATFKLPVKKYLISVLTGEYNEIK